MELEDEDSDMTVRTFNVARRSSGNTRNAVRGSVMYELIMMKLFYLLWVRVQKEPGERKKRVERENRKIRDARRRDNEAATNRNEKRNVKRHKRKPKKRRGQHGWK